MTSIEVIEAYSDALAKGDTAAVFSYFSPDAKWHQPGSNRFSGTKTGIEAIAQFLGEMMKVTKGTLQIQVKGPMMSNGNTVAFPVRFIAENGDKTIDMDGIDIYEVVNEKIVSVMTFSQDQAGEDGFWK